MLSFFTGILLSKVVGIVFWGIKVNFTLFLCVVSYFVKFEVYLLIIGSKELLRSLILCSVVSSLLYDYVCFNFDNCLWFNKFF